MEVASILGETCAISRARPYQAPSTFSQARQNMIDNLDDLCAIRTTETTSDSSLGP